MDDMTTVKEVINEVRGSAANNKSTFLRYADELNPACLAKHYEEIRSNAPERSKKNLKYLFQRFGAPSSGADSNRTEEHLAIALYLEFHNQDKMLLPNGQQLEIVDYQVPLKAAQSDGRVGKVDMLGLIDGERLAVLELKVKGGDAPLGATLEALVYAAILEHNLADIGQELESKGYRKFKPARPEIIVLGPVDYWRTFHAYDEDWIRKLEPKLREIQRTIGLKIRFIELEIGELEKGHSGSSPRLDGDVRARSVCSSIAD